MTKKLGAHLLCEQIPAEGDAAFQRYGSKVRALAALGFRPGAERGRDSSKGETKKA